MPELPEVETVCSALRKNISRQQIEQVIVRHDELRWPIPQNLKALLITQSIDSISRRGKYILIQFSHGTLIIHLGMSGSIRLLPNPGPAPNVHDHLDIIFSNQLILRYRDPRRFGAILWTQNEALQHPLLVKLGPEPLTAEFNSDYLYTQTRKRKSSIKLIIMNSEIVAGVGNIYANEALFLANIHPARPGHTLNINQCEQLSASIKEILCRAIKVGGTTLNDFYQSDGKPGYFSQQLSVYGKTGQACPRCYQPLKGIIINQRSTVYCSHCQL